VRSNVEVTMSVASFSTTREYDMISDMLTFADKRYDLSKVDEEEVKEGGLPARGNIVAGRGRVSSQ
jgi:hypothetical protein